MQAALLKGAAGASWLPVAESVLRAAGEGAARLFLPKRRAAPACYAGAFVVRWQPDELCLPGCLESDGGLAVTRRFEEIEHTADIAIRVWGRDLAELFANAAYGMACQLADPDDVELVVQHPIALEAYDVETLLVAWLGELLYLGERDGCVFVKFDIAEIEPTKLGADVQGGAVQVYRSHIKAVTFSGLRILQTDDGYETAIVFDV
jgi:SHS2 domain-containing protein